MSITFPSTKFIVNGQDLGALLYATISNEIKGRFAFAIISRHACRLEELEELEAQILIAETVPADNNDLLQKVIEKLCKQFKNGCPTGTSGVVIWGGYWIAVHGAPQGGVRDASLKIAKIIERLSEPNPAPK